MKKILTTMTLAFLAIGNVTADEVTVNDITIPQNASATLSICLNNENTYMQLFELKLVLPEGVTMVANSQQLSDRFGVYAQLQYNEVQTREYKFLCQAGTDVTPISGNSGELMTVKLQVDPTLDVGTTLQGYVEGIEVTTTDVTAWNPADLSFAITVGEPSDLRTVLDENSTDVPEEALGVNVRVKRTIKADEWSTICLPFAMTAAQMKAAFGNEIQLCEFTGTVPEFDDNDNVVGITVNFDAATEIAANHPYIIKVAKAITHDEGFTVDGVDVTPDEDGAYIEFDNGKSGSRRVVYSGFYGTYHAETVLDEYTLFLSDNKFWYSTGATKMKAFRAYFDFLDVLTDVENASARVAMSFDETTGILSTTNLTNYTNSAGAWYDLSGRRISVPSVSSEPSVLSKGVYIRNGRKVVIK